MVPRISTISTHLHSQDIKSPGTGDQDLIAYIFLIP